MKKTLAAIVLIVTGWPAAGHAQISRLSFADKPRLVRCGDQPCFRLLLDAATASAQPAALPEASRSYKVVDLRSKKEIPVFYCAPLLGKEGLAAAERPIYSLLLFDLSGSMNRSAGGAETRYAAAVRVLQNFIASHFKPATDRWAIVGFHSRNVINDVQRAVFAETREDVLEQSRRLQQPGPTNNTALYTAIEAALPILKRQKDSGSEARLFVFTDGKNEVFPGAGDDSDLLGAEGFGKVKQDAENQRVEIISIGFGARGDADYDEQVLKSLAWPTSANYHFAGDGASLANVFEQDRQKLASRVQLTVGPVAESKNQLTGRIPLQVYVDGVALDQDELLYVPPPMTPVFEGSIAGNEAAAFADSRPTVRTGRNPLAQRLVIVVAYLLFFGLAGMVVPRVLWPERYAARRVASPASSPGAISGRAKPRDTAGASPPEPRVAKESHGGAVRRLEIVEGPDTGAVFSLRKDVTTVGTLESDVDWALVDIHRKISRRHCEFTREGGSYFVIDRSTNGTFLNGHALKVNEPVRIRPNDRIRLADTVTLAFR